MYKLKIKLQLEFNQTSDYISAEEFRNALEQSGLKLELKDLTNPSDHTKEIIKEYIKNDFENTVGNKVNYITVDIESDGK